MDNVQVSYEKWAVDVNSLENFSEILNFSGFAVIAFDVQR